MRYAAAMTSVRKRARSVDVGSSFDPKRAKLVLENTAVEKVPATVPAPAPKKSDDEFVTIGNFATPHIVLDEVDIIYTRQVQSELELVETKKHLQISQNKLLMSNTALEETKNIAENTEKELQTWKKNLQETRDRLRVVDELLSDAEEQISCTRINLLMLMQQWLVVLTELERHDASILEINGFLAQLQGTCHQAKAAEFPNYSTTTLFWSSKIKKVADSMTSFGRVRDEMKDRIAVNAPSASVIFHHQVDFQQSQRLAGWLEESTNAANEREFISWFNTSLLTCKPEVKAEPKDP